MRNLCLPYARCVAAREHEQVTSSFQAPGVGQWALDRSHFPSGVTPLSQWFLREGMVGFEHVFEELGLPAKGMGLEFVNGFMYSRLLPLIGADAAPRKPPPDAILKLAFKLHPELRARNKTAIATLRDRPSNKVVARWDNELRPKLIATNQRLQAFAVDTADDAALQQHITELVHELRDNCVLHFWLHGHDLGPIARFLHHCIQAGLKPTDAIGALAGASPSTARPLETLVELRGLLEATSPAPTTLEEFRNSSHQAGSLLDAYLEERGQVLATGYDLDARRLIEMPEAIMNSIRSATPPPRHDPEALAADLRQRVPASDQATFDITLADARAVMDMRDDNGPLTLEWPVGLLRRALLAASGVTLTANSPRASST